VAAFGLEGRRRSTPSVSTSPGCDGLWAGSQLPDASKVGGYQLASTVSSDWFRFQALAEAARRVDTDKAMTIWRAGLGLVRGVPFAGAAKGTFGWAWDELIVAAMETSSTDVAHRVPGVPGGRGRTQADWAAGRGLLAVATSKRPSAWSGSGKT
jgi:hypothetical protein